MTLPPPVQTTPEGRARFVQLLDELAAMHAAKQADYADGSDAYSNMRRADRLGISPYLGCLLRMSDKFERVIQLSKHPPQVKDESIYDTLKDLATYALIACILRGEEGDGGERT